MGSFDLCFIHDTVKPVVGKFRIRVQMHVRNLIFKGYFLDIPISPFVLRLLFL